MIPKGLDRYIPAGIGYLHNAAVGGKWRWV
jgi:hypothetical protein